MPAERRHPRLLRVVLATVASCLLHALLYGVMQLGSLRSDLPFELVVPSELTLGVADAVEVEALPPPQVTPPTSPTPAATTDPGEGSGALDAGVRRRDAGVDAGVDDAAVDAALADAATDGALDGGWADADAEALDASADADAAAEGVDAALGPPAVSTRATEGRMRLPPGGAVALRIDLASIRGTPLEPSASALLAENPDFQKVLGQAGLDVVRDVDQFLMASPVPYDRSRYLFLARVPHDASWVRARVDATAAAHGRTVSWGETEGFPSAPWVDDDVAAGRTERVVLLLDAHHLLVARPEDVSRAIAWIRASSRDEDGGGGAAGLVGLGRDELLALQVDGARRYVGGVDLTTIPTGLRLSLSREAAEYHLGLRGDYPAEAEAEAGTAWVSGLRDQYANRLEGSFLTRSYAGLLRRVDLRSDETRLRADLTMSEVTTTSLVSLIQTQMAALYAGLAEAARQDRARE